MKSTRQELVTLKAECTIYQNGFQLNSKKKSKLATISFDPNSLLLIVIGKGEGQEFKFPLPKLKNIHKRFIEEGKITLDFDSHQEGIVQKGLYSIQDSIQDRGINQIFINGANSQNLKFLVQSLKKYGKPDQKEAKGQKKVKSENKDQMKRMRSSAKEEGSEEDGQKRRRNLKQRPEVDEEPNRKLSKRDFLTLINNNGKMPVKQMKRCSMKEAERKKVSIHLSDLPYLLLNNIFSYSGLSLSYRLISKKLEEFVLRNIFTIRLRDEIDGFQFNKLCKWAVNVECRMKNVKVLKLSDRFDNQQLEKNRAKTLKFGNWREISAKNINQLKGLRIFCLELPYSIKFQFKHLFGLRLVELRLKENYKASPINTLIQNQDILHFINTIVDLKVIQLPHASNKVLTEIKNKQKMQEIRIGVLNQVGEIGKWEDLRQFINLRVLAIEAVQKMGVKEDQGVKHQIKWAQNLNQLEIGMNLSLKSRIQMPCSIHKLKLLGSHWRNCDIQNVVLVILQFYLPKLQQMDISACPYLSPDCLESLQNVHIHTNWNNNQLQHARHNFSMQNITVSSGKGFSYC